MKQFVHTRVLPTLRSAEELEKKFKKNILLGFPRSGNTAIRLFLEKYTHMPTGRPLIINGMSIGTDTNSSVLFSEIELAKCLDIGVVLTKIHKLWEIDLLKNDKIIYLLRDYHDCIPSILRFDNDIFAKWYVKRDKENFGFSCYADFVKVLIDFSYNYGEQLKQFHFLPLNKMVIYYEDFVNNFEVEAKKLLEFLEIKVNIDKIKENNVVNVHGRKETDDHFNRIGKTDIQINKGCTRFIGEYSGVLSGKEYEIVTSLFMNQLGEKLYTHYLGRYE